VSLPLKKAPLIRKLKLTLNMNKSSEQREAFGQAGGQGGPGHDSLFSAVVLLSLVWVAFSTVPSQGATYALGATALVEGPTAGSDSVVLAASPTNAAWTAMTNAAWLHLSRANQGGAGNTNVVFSYDANPGATRTGTLTIAGLTLSVTQAGSTYVAAPLPATTLASSGLHAPTGVAVDGAGNVYIADNDNNTIRKWTRANNSVTTVISTGLSSPAAVAVDGAGNIYIANTYSNVITMWTASNNTVSTLISSGLNLPFGVAVDGAGNVYIADTLNSVIKEWTAAGNTVSTLVSNGLNHPFDVAVDGAGNVYIADYGNNAIKKWSTVSNIVTTVASNGLSSPAGVAVDGAGNVYIADSGNNAIKKWTAASNTVTTLVSSGLSYPFNVAVDGAGNVYIADTLNNAIKELPRAFVDPTAKAEGSAAGSDALPVVLPATENLLAPFVPTCDQPWLTFNGITNGVVSFAFSSSAGTNRAANINLLGQTIPVTQIGVITPPTIVGAALSGNGAFQFAFSNSQGVSFTVLSTTNLSLPLTNWTVAGTPTNVAPGLFQFTAPVSTNESQLFYRVRSP